MILADATDLGYPTRFTLPSLQPVLCNTATPCTNTISPYSHRLFLPKKETRELLHKFLSGQPTKMNTTEWHRLLKHVKKQQLSLGILIIYFNNNIKYLILKKYIINKKLNKILIFFKIIKL